SLVLAASCLSMSTAIPVVFFSPSPTCFSTSRMVSSECTSFAFLTCVTALDRTLLSESFALLLSCLASFTRVSLCSRVTLQGKVDMRGKERRPKEQTDSARKNLYICVLVCVCVCVCVCDRLTSGKLLIAPKQIQIHVISSLSALRTAVISPFTSSRLMMSSTRAELIFTLADWPFALAWMKKREKEEKALREE
uniref:Uncharacterized protein n=1 Tax=Dicentrarchus labrax TaxID=13489 RepID=A0A8C4I5P2_DICLA